MGRVKQDRCRANRTPPVGRFEMGAKQMKRKNVFSRALFRVDVLNTTSDILTV